MKQSRVNKKKLLVIDLSYSLSDIHERRNEGSLHSRDLNGFFEQVWSCHPFADLVDPSLQNHERGLLVQQIAPNHTFIQNVSGVSNGGFIKFFFNQISLISELKRLVRRESISVIKVTDPHYLGLLGLILSRITGSPLVVRVGANFDEIHRTTKRPLMPKLLRWIWVEQALQRIVLHKADAIVAANQDNLLFAIKNGARKTSSIVIGYGSLLESFHFLDPDSRENFTDLEFDSEFQSRYLLAFLGRLEPVKIPEDAIQCLARIRANGIDAGLVLVGYGSMLEQLKQLSIELGLENFVWFAGQRDQIWISKFLVRSNVVLSPITGRALSEACLAAAPTVAYDIDWQSEIIEDCVTGRLVPYKDVDALAIATTELLLDPVEAMKLGRNARERALKLLDPAELANREAALITTILETR